MEINPISMNSLSLTSSMMLQKIELFRQQAITVDQSETDAAFTTALMEISAFIAGEIASGNSDQITDRVKKERALSIFSHIDTVDMVLLAKKKKIDALLATIKALIAQLLSGAITPSKIRLLAGLIASLGEIAPEMVAEIIEELDKLIKKILTGSPSKEMVAAVALLIQAIGRQPSDYGLEGVSGATLTGVNGLKEAIAGFLPDASDQEQTTLIFVLKAMNQLPADYGISIDQQPFEVSLELRSAFAELMAPRMLERLNQISGDILDDLSDSLDQLNI